MAPALQNHGGVNCMWKILIIGRRSFIVGREEVLKGGIHRSYPAGETTKHEVELQPSRYPYHVTNECGKKLESFGDVNIIEKDGQEIVDEPENEQSAEERIAQLEAQIKELTAKKSRTRKPKEPAKK